MSERKVMLSPSMMCADFLTLKEELDVLIEQQVEMLHIDIMDGQYVPNFTLGTDLAKQMYNYSSIPLDYHLMIENVDQSIDIFLHQEGSTITFHPETTWHPVRTIQSIRAKHCKPSIAIDPAMTIDSVKHLLPLVDMAVIMTVNPGYAGQKVIPFCIDKIAELNKWKKENHPSLVIEVDGNVSWENIPPMVNAGSNVLVLGTSSVFTKEYPRQEAYQKLKSFLN
tara:strand:- start:23 stop:694 length:672 start_codon:yes stop_codon:yes gene_type:complete